MFENYNNIIDIRFASLATAYVNTLVVLPEMLDGGVWILKENNFTSFEIVVKIYSKRIKII